MRMTKNNAYKAEKGMQSADRETNPKNLHHIHLAPILPPQPTPHPDTHTNCAKNSVSNLYPLLVSSPESRNLVSFPSKTGYTL